MKIFNDMNHIHDKKIKIIAVSTAECNILNNIPNPYKHNKNKNTHY